MSVRVETETAPHLEQVLGGRYRVEALLGEGGFAWVYRARHTGVEHLRVAIKVLKPERAGSEDDRKRFLREAQTASALRNRHVVQVQDVGRTGDGLPFIVMEYIDGEPLDAVLQRRGRLTPREVAEIARDVLLALIEAHALNVVHRDLKPANVFLVSEHGGRSRYAKVLDFGIAKLLGSDVLGPSTATVAGMVPCTPEYAAPELLHGQPVPQTDLYALGHLMLELLEGRTAYEGVPHRIEIVARQLSPDPVPLGPETQSSGLATVIARALQKEAGARYASAEEMLDALDACFGGLEGPSIQQLTGPHSRPSRPPGHAPTPTTESDARPKRIPSTWIAPAEPLVDETPAPRTSHQGLLIGVALLMLLAIVMVAGWFILEHASEGRVAEVVAAVSSTGAEPPADSAGSGDAGETPAIAADAAETPPVAAAPDRDPERHGDCGDPASVPDDVPVEDWITYRCVDRSGFRGRQAACFRLAAGRGCPTGELCCPGE